MSSTLRWFTSSYSNASGGECIEVAFDWRTSSYSSSSGGDCVEVAACPHAVHVRDSKVTDGPAFAVAPDAWSTFVTWAE
ncbi:DUF397 domain-containing protein [Streptomyces microflavus]|uniref:DUF397 domain-containing protein n=1 Tax=Streptomyces TaxID=1883 RepID=UPI000B919949|nr:MULTISPECIES: DUF397 domain-containing protein [Streptomyces]OXY93902.1 DUF397 domain-containing protein [Streptomyces sp. 2R]QQZ54945.1 DUF397 domain-containing protein [Streptomyces microflavus]WTF70192.1 DUF397 domain-containing protein [Streptomyces microflavus]